MITIQNYVQAESLEQAWQLNQKRSARVLGGMLWLKMGKNTVGTAIDPVQAGVGYHRRTRRCICHRRYGHAAAAGTAPRPDACTRGAVAKALQPIVGVQFRNLATAGGSIWGRFGFSDVLTLFLALDAKVELYKGGVMPLELFAALPYDRDILVRLIVPKTSCILAYEAMRIQRTDLPVLTCAVAQTGGETRAVIGARPGKAVVVRDANGLLHNGVTPESAAAFADYVAGQVPMGSNNRGSAAVPQPSLPGFDPACHAGTGRLSSVTDVKLILNGRGRRRSGGCRPAADRLSSCSWLRQRQARLRDVQLRVVHRADGRQAGPFLLDADTARCGAQHPDAGGPAGGSRRFRRIHC